MGSTGLKFLFSNRLTIVWLVVFAFAMGYATFLENDYGTPAARDMIYNAWWFEVLMVLLALNFVGNIVRYKLFTLKKWGLFTFHIAFVIVLMGAFVTRYFGYEGHVNIREGNASNELITLQKYLQIESSEGDKYVYDEEALELSVLSTPSFEVTTGIHRAIEVKGVEFIPDAEKKLEKSSTGQVIFELAVANQEGRRDVYIPWGEEMKVGNQLLSLGSNNTASTLQVTKKEDDYFIHSPTGLDFMTMGSQMAGSVKSDSAINLNLATLYTNSNLSIVVKDIHINKKVVWKTTEDKSLKGKLPEVLKVSFETKTDKDAIYLPARTGVISEPIRLKVGKQEVALSYGPKRVELPFYLYLDDFKLIRYPGSSSPSEYSSDVVVNDGDISFPYTIFMNNVLDYKGYRFFQASYDTDELGTVLSVNHDALGTNLTYLGYFLLIVGMFGTLFGKSSRFSVLNKQLKQLNKKKSSVVALLIFLSCSITNSIAQVKQVNVHDVLKHYQPIPSKEADKFGELLVQDMDGRIKPINSLASEFIRKIVGRTTYKYSKEEVKIELNANQFFLALHQNSVLWQYVPVLKVEVKKSQRILDTLGVQKDRLAFIDLLDIHGDYKLAHWVERVNRLKPSQRNEEDKEVLKLDERFNVLYTCLLGNYLKLFPKKGDKNNTWYSGVDKKVGFEDEDSLFVYHIIPTYFGNVAEAQKSGDWAEVDKNISYIKTYQNYIAKEIIPSEGRRKAEIWYNKAQLFIWLFPAYWTTGLVLLILAIVKLFFPYKNGLKLLYKSFTFLVVICFLLQTINMVVRWYAGGYPPWSNGYEMTLLVAWCLVLFGVFFTRKTDFVLPLAALFTGTLLFVAFLDWLNPEITNLVPVLKSYWLKIHVAVIVGSYAPLALSALLGLTALCLMMGNQSRNKRLKTAIKELTALNEISMIIGVFLLTIGTFLGGVWANESWGRYWGWDPKETWALISIIVYAAVLHFRLIPKLNNSYLFSISSVIAFFSIIMTSYGVNYYLSGMHSYAKGDPVPIPVFVYYVIGILVAIGVGAYWRQKTNIA